MAADTRRDILCKVGSPDHAEQPELSCGSPHWNRAGMNGIALGDNIHVNVCVGRRGGGAFLRISENFIEFLRQCLCENCEHTLAF